MEKPMHKKPVGFLNDQKVSYKKQFGFQKKKKMSTAHAVISLVENIEKSINNKLLFPVALLRNKKHLIWYCRS